MTATDLPHTHIAVPPWGSVPGGSVRGAQYPWAQYRFISTAPTAVAGWGRLPAPLAALPCRGCRPPSTCRCRPMNRARRDSDVWRQMSGNDRKLRAVALEPRLLNPVPTNGVFNQSKSCNPAVPKTRFMTNEQRTGLYILSCSYFALHDVLQAEAPSVSDCRLFSPATATVVLRAPVVRPTPGGTRTTPNGATPSPIHQTRQTDPEPEPESDGAAAERFAQAPRLDLRRSG